MVRGILRGACAILGALAMSGCDQLFEKDSKQSAAAADKKAAAGDYHAAIRLYEASLDGTSKTADSHYKLGLLYEDKLKSPRDAIHHLDRYLAMAPNGAHVRDARDLMKACEKRLAASMNDGTPMTQKEAVQLKNDNAALRKQLVELRAQKAATPAPGQRDKPAPGTRTHVVAQGETLASIAQKYYKNRNRAQDILDANFNALGGKNTIKAGQKLIIPQ
jgi:LysM repeat protein